MPTRMFNARCESVAAKHAFRGLLAKHRLIVPADGFNEWRRGPDLARQPYYIHRLDGRPLALAGPWASWRGPEQPRDDNPLRSATILTTVPNAFMGQIHEAIPVGSGVTRPAIKVGRTSKRSVLRSWAETVPRRTAGG